jgi:hypothetical protein
MHTQTKFQFLTSLSHCDVQNTFHVSFDLNISCLNMLWNSKIYLKSFEASKSLFTRRSNKFTSFLLSETFTTENCIYSTPNYHAQSKLPSLCHPQLCIKAQELNYPQRKLSNYFHPRQASESFRPLVSDK